MNMEQALTSAKKYVNKNNLFALGAYGLALVFVLISSIPEIILDPKQVFTIAFLTKEIIAVIITIVSMTCFIFIGRNNNSIQPLSVINVARDKFKKTRDVIVNNDLLFSGFEQWVESKFNLKEQENKNKRLLRNVGIKNLNYLDLDYNQLNELLTCSQKYDNVYYKQINKKQYSVLIFIMSGKASIPFPKWTDYLSDKTYNDELEISEILAKESSETSKYMLASIASKVLMGVLLGAVLASIVYDATRGEDISAKERTITTIMNIVQRLFNATWSAFLGYKTGKEMNDRASKYIELKSTVHDMYLKDKNFVPKSEQEIAREEWLKSEREKNRKANEEYANKLGLREPEVENQIIALGETKK